MGGWIRRGWIWRFGAPRFLGQRSQNPPKEVFWDLWTEKLGTPKTPNPTTTDPTSHSRPSEQQHGPNKTQKQFLDPSWTSTPTCNICINHCPMLPDKEEKCGSQARQGHPGARPRVFESQGRTDWQISCEGFGDLGKDFGEDSLEDFFVTLPAVFLPRNVKRSVKIRPKSAHKNLSKNPHRKPHKKTHKKSLRQTNAYKIHAVSRCLKMFPHLSQIKTWLWPRVRTWTWDGHTIELKSSFPRLQTHIWSLELVHHSSVLFCPTLHAKSQKLSFGNLFGAPDSHGLSICFDRFSVSISQFQSVSINFSQFDSSKTQEFVDNRKVGETTRNHSLTRRKSPHGTQHFKALASKSSHQKEFSNTLSQPPRKPRKLEEPLWKKKQPSSFEIILNLILNNWSQSQFGQLQK